MIKKARKNTLKNVKKILKNSPVCPGDVLPGRPISVCIARQFCPCPPVSPQPIPGQGQTQRTGQPGQARAKLAYGAGSGAGTGAGSGADTWSR